ncbi:MAG: helix-turn-helix domain-containing protein [Kiritimatiellae bacterium]|nr:helix-turn-helix domain-containing protein [Kiritimatiellia bacterium]
MTQTTRQIIKAALDGDATISVEDRSRILSACRGDGDSRDMRTFTAPKAAKILNVSLATINRMKRSGELRTRRVRGRNRITAESLYSL